MVRFDKIASRVMPWLVLVILFALVGQAHAAQRNLAQRYLLNAAGDITIASSINLHCSTATGDTGAADCVNARNGVGNRTNNLHTMVNVDVDASAATFNSSRAFLNLPVGASVAFAGLYWAGDSAATTPRNQVAWATPSSAAYTTLTASVVDDSAAAGTANQYQAFADVTAQVSAAGRGTYTVANISSTVNTANVYAGWSLVVVYRLASEPTRNMVVYDGYRRVAGAASVDITLTGFTTPPFGTVTSKLGVVGYDGDRGSPEGTAGLQFGTSTATLSPVFNAVNPQTDVFNSTISALGSDVTTRAPPYLNTLGYDADLLVPNTPLPNGATSAVVRVASSGETIDLGVVTLSTNIFVPNIKDSFLKSVVDLNGGLVLPGDVLEYTINFANTGNDPATRTVVIDPIPSSATYVPNSIVLTSTTTGMPTGARTDAAGDDAAEFDAANNRVVARVGRNATATAGGLFNPGDGQQLRFRVTVNTGTPGGTLVDNFANVSYRAQTVGTDITDVSDADVATAGDQPARVVVASPDLSVAKTHTPANFAQATVLPSTPTFALVVSNNGPAPSFGTVTVSDILPAGFSALTLSGAGWSCNLITVSCIRTDALPAGASFPTVTLTVIANITGTFTNTATTACNCESAAQSANNTGTDSVVVLPSLNLSIAKSNTVTALVSGQTVTYDITIGNSGPGNAGGAVVTDPAVTGLSCTAVTCAVASGAGVCPSAPISLAAFQGAGVTIPGLPANASVVFSLLCTVTATGQ